MKYLIHFFLALILLNCEKKIDTGELFLPNGFSSSVFVDSLAQNIRHLSVNSNGDLYAKYKSIYNDNSLIAIRDNNNDGIADTISSFGKFRINSKKSNFEWAGLLETGARIRNGYLYYSSELVVYRVKLDENLVPTSKPEVIVIDDHDHGAHEHIAKPITFDGKGGLYVPFGAPSNACVNPKRTPLMPGLDPCPQLEDHAGIWRFDENKLNQTQSDGIKYATGIRSIVALDWNFENNSLYAVVHGRDNLFRLWPQKYSRWESAMLPSEEFIKIEKGDNFGWPYCYYDQIKGKKVLGPEYGGDGNIIGRCHQYKDPEIGFPGHWAPNDLVFYTGSDFPARYKNGAFVAFHGSTNRAPYPQSSYFVAFIPFKEGKPTGEYEIFADGFAQIDPIASVDDAEFRPMGIAFSPKGGMFIGDTKKGRIWKIEYYGDKNRFNSEDLVEMEMRKLSSHIRTPDEEKDKIEIGTDYEYKDGILFKLDKPKEISVGQELYNIYCISCHQGDGKGAEGRFPTLVGTEWVVGDKKRLINVLLKGLEGKIIVNGETWNGYMPQHSFLSDQQITDVLNYIRKSFGNEATLVLPTEVDSLRTLSQLLNRVPTNL